MYMFPEWLILVLMQCDTHTHRASWLLYTYFGLMSSQALPLRFLCAPSRGDGPVSFQVVVFSSAELRVSVCAIVGSHISFVWPYYAVSFSLGHTSWGPYHVQLPHSKCSETVMAMIVMMTAFSLFRASVHRLSGLHCSATLIKSQWVRSIYDCELIRES